MRNGRILPSREYARTGPRSHSRCHLDLQLFTSSLFLQESVEEHEEVLHLVGKRSLLFRVLNGFNQLVDFVSHLLGSDTGRGASEILRRGRQWSSFFHGKETHHDRRGSLTGSIVLIGLSGYRQLLGDVLGCGLSVSRHDERIKSIRRKRKDKQTTNNSSLQSIYQGSDVADRSHSSQ